MQEWLPMAAAAVLGAAGCKSPQEMRFGPYVTNPAQESMVVRWASDGLEKGVVRLYCDGKPVGEVKACAEELRYPADPETRGLSLEGLAKEEIGTAYLYWARFDHLQPGTDYRYMVEFGKDLVEGGFRTLATEPEPFTFIALGDSHAADVVSDQFGRHEPAWILHLGDLVHYESYGQYNSYFSPIVNEMLKWQPMAVVRGNHDQRGQLLSRLFGLDPEQKYYAFKDGNCLLVGLDSSVWRRSNPEEKTAVMLEWAEQILRDSDATWKIVAFHEPPYDMSYRRSSWGRNDAMAVFRRTGVDLILNGHAHTYQRFAPMYQHGENEEHPILLVNSSGAGDTYATLARRADPYLVERKEGNHYVVFHIDGQSLTGRALALDGGLIDEFSVQKKDGRLKPEYVEQALPEEPLGRLQSALFRQYMKMPGGEFEPGDEFGVEITFPAGTQPIRYDFRPSPDSKHAVELVEKTSGEVPPGKSITVAVPLRAKAGIRDVGPKGLSEPRIFLDCHYEVEEIKGVISSTRVYAWTPDDEESGTEAENPPSSMP